MDEAESMIGGMSDDDSSSATNNGGGGGDDGGGEIITVNNEVEHDNQNGSSSSELISTALEDGVVDDEDDDDEDDDVMNPVTAASALSDLVGSVGGVVVGGLSSIMEGNQNHHHHHHNHHQQHHHQQQSQDSSCPLVAPTRYLQVEGFDGRRNDVVYCTPLRSLLRNSCGNASSNHEESSSSSTESSSCSTASETDAQSSSQKEGGGEGQGGSSEDDKPKVMLFFGGDIQDFPEMMEQHRDHRNYVQFNLEATALQLQKQFPDHHIAVVRPSRIQMLTFSCYDNFVHCNHTGAPEHVITHHSLHHLELLLQNLSKQIASSKEAAEEDEVDSGEDEGLNIKNQINKLKDCGDTNEGKSNCHNNSNNSDEDSTVSSTTVDESSSTSSTSTTTTTNKAAELSSAPSEGGRQCNNSSSTNGSSSSKISRKKSKTNAKNVRLDRAWISLVGFSKGCVVLNQLLYEFHYLKTLTPDDLSMDDFLHCIKDMYWLDGGHNGGKNTWITSRSLLETLTRLGVRIHVHLTPYQLLDDRRPWIRKEEKLFSELLKKFSAPIVRQIHFENEPASLQQHLRIIADFNLHPLPMQQQPQHLQQPSLLHRRDDEIDGGGGGIGEGVEENHKPVVNVVMDGGGESIIHENNMEH